MEDEVETTGAEQSAPPKKEKRKVAKKAAKKKTAAKKSAAKKSAPRKPKANGDTLAAQFGFREDSDRGLLLAAMVKNLGKPMTGAQLAKHLANGEGEGAVSICMNRIETKAALHKLPYKLMRDTNDKGERTYTLASGRR